MSTVHPFPIPELLLFDWALVFCGLGTSVGVLFELIRLSADKKLEHRVYTLTNFWLVLSGVIHVRDSIQCVHGTQYMTSDYSCTDISISASFMHL
jgi:hypothetical protein